MPAKKAVLLIGCGIVVGLALALATGRLLERLLYGVEPTDPVSLAVVLSLMVVIGIVACLIPARRATQIHPMLALRQE